MRTKRNQSHRAPKWGTTTSTWKKSRLLSFRRTNCLNTSFVRKYCKTETFLDKMQTNPLHQGSNCFLLHLYKVISSGSATDYKYVLFFFFLHLLSFLSSWSSFTRVWYQSGGRACPSTNRRHSFDWVSHLVSLYTERAKNGHLKFG